MVGVAIAGSAVAGLAGSAISAGGASSAAGTEASAARQAAAEQASAAGAAGNLDVQGAAQANVLDEAGLGQADTNAGNYYSAAEGVLNPYVQYGQDNLEALSGAQGFAPTGFAAYLGNQGAFAPTGLATAATTGMSQAQLEQTPGYQFTLAQGLESAQNGAAARGLGVSGAASKAASTYATGLANNTYTTQMGLANQAYQNELSSYDTTGQLSGEAYQNQLQGYQSNINKMEDITGIGSSAAGTLGNLASLTGQTTTNAILGTTQQMGSNTAGAYNSAGQALVGAASANATGINNAAGDVGAGDIATSNAYATGLQGAGNAATQYALYQQYMNQAGGYGSGTAAQGFSSDNNPYTTGWKG